MMELCLRYPRQIQLLSRILSCNFSSVASSICVKPRVELLPPPPYSIRGDVLDLTEELGRIRKDAERLNKLQSTVPFVFPRYFDDKSVVLCQAAEVINTVGSENEGAKGQEEPKGKPTPEQVETVYLKLCDDIPRLFTTTQDFRIYDPNVVLEDNIRNLVITGLQNYAINISLLKLTYHLKYAHVKMNVLRATQHPEEGTVKIRWRIVRGPGFIKMMATFWRFNPIAIFKNKTVPEADSDWVDGFSIFYINDQGKITRHVVEKMMPDDDKIVETAKKAKLNVAI